MPNLIVETRFLSEITPTGNLGWHFKAAVELYDKKRASCSEKSNLLAFRQFASVFFYITIVCLI